MSHSKGLSQLKYKKENFKLLKEEINKIKNNIDDEIYETGLSINDNAEYVWRARNKKRILKSPPEEKYNFNEILKYYEFNKDKYLLGFTSQYFRKLSDLMSNPKNKKYSKDRIDLFNSRIIYSQKLLLNKIKKKNEDPDQKEKNAKSSYNNFMNPFMTIMLDSIENKKDKKTKIKFKKNGKTKNHFLSHKNYRNNHNNNNQNQNFSSNNISILSYKNFMKEIKNKNELTIFPTTKNEISSISNKKSIPKCFSDNNISNSNNKVNLYLDYLSFCLNKKKYKNKNETIDYSKIDAKEEFLKNLDKDKYFDYLKYKYNFYESYKLNNKRIIFDLKNRKRRDMFKNPKDKFLQNVIKNTDRSIFLKKIKRQKEDEYSVFTNTSNSHKNLIKKQLSNLSSTQSRFIKTMKFNDDCHSIFEKFKKDYNSS